MTRFIEIFADDDIQLLTTDELPFIVSLDIETEQKILITSANEPGNKIQGIQCAYIAEDDGHLFFQPEVTSTERAEIKIFHNDEIIEKSVWIKSGDIITIENKIIIFKISGDRIEIRIIDRKETKFLSPPPTEELIIIKSRDNPENNSNSLPDITKNNKEKNNRKTPTKLTRNLLLLLLILLLFVASFILFAETVTIAIEPQADQVELNGLIPAVKLGHRYIVIGGQYQLTASKQGYKSIDKLLQIDSNNNHFSLQMKELPGLLKFRVKPEKNNQIFLNDVLLGHASDGKNTVIQYEVEKGEYTLKIINPRYKIYEQKIKVEGKNQSQAFFADLKPNWGVIKINSEPENVLIEIEAVDSKTHRLKSDIRKYYTPAEIELVSGNYELTIKKEKYKTKKNKISVNAEQTIQLGTIELQAEDAQIKVASKPTGSIVRVDGKYYGKTPITISIPALVEHEIEVSLSGFNINKSTVKLEPETIKNLNFTLKENTGTVFISSSPKQAKLYINGKRQKKSFGKFFLKGKNNIITAKAKGYKTQTKKINASIITKNISFILEKISNSTATKTEHRTSEVQVKTKNNYINSIGQKMILLQATEFTMGSVKNEIGRRSNEPEHKVKLTQAYYLSEKEVSNKQFKQFRSEHKSGFSSGQSLDISHHPVVNISWEDAAKFANWLSIKEGLKPYYKEHKGKMIPISLTTKIDGYRLPFEAEWEYAARGQNKQKYPWNGSFPPKVASGNFADESARSQVSLVIVGYTDKHSVSAPIGSYQANPFGFYDLGGNVSEWCQDYYVPYSTSGQLAIDPVGPERGTHKVVRDSSWRDSSITELRLSYRGYSKKAMNDIGFRIARSAL